MKNITNRFSLKFAFFLMLGTFLVGNINATQGQTSSAYSTPNLYASLRGGVNLLHANEQEDIQLVFNEGYFFSGAFGYRLNEYFRGEAEVCYRYNTASTVTFFGFTTPSGGHARTYSGFFNAYLDWPGAIQCCSSSVTPYIGAGIGYSDQEINACPYSLDSNGRKKGLAGQILAGFQFCVFEKFEAGVEYRFHHGKARYLYDNTVDATISYRF